MRFLKKFLSVLLVIALVIPAFCVAEDDEPMDRSEYYEYVNITTKEILTNIVSKYESDKDSFDADYIFFAYTYFKEWMALRTITSLEILWNTTQPGTVSFKGNFKEVEKGCAMIERMMDEDYEKWLKEEKSDAEFAEYIIKMIKAMALSDSETK